VTISSETTSIGVVGFTGLKDAERMTRIERSTTAILAECPR
jgi:hypothetical protein